MEVPVGTVLPYAGVLKQISAIQPTGVWMLCDGREVDRAIYAELYKVIGDFWGEGDGDVTFNIPDLRGQFLRGVTYDKVDSHGNPIDPDINLRSRPNSSQHANEVGSYQADMVGKHNHYRRGDHDTEGSGATTDTCASLDILMNKRLEQATVPADDAGIVADQNKVNWQNIGNESRSKNAYVNFIIKVLATSDQPVKSPSRGLQPGRH